MKILWSNSKKLGKIEFWEGDNGRWYWHQVKSGNITGGGDYASRRSCRRALRRMFGPGGSNQ